MTIFSKKGSIGFACLKLGNNIDIGILPETWVIDTLLSAGIRPRDLIHSYSVKYGRNRGLERCFGV